MDSLARDASPTDRLRVRLRANLAALRGRITGARGRSPHAASAVELLVVTKSAPTSLFPLLAAEGVRDVAENRVQAAEARRVGAPPGWRWHGVGHVQTNKARRALALFDVFHALDSLDLAQHLDRQWDSVRASAAEPWPVYIQVNAAADPRKGGIGPTEALPFVKALARLPHLAPVGFMTMARLGSDPTEARAAFRALRQVRDDVLADGVTAGAFRPAGLSMGMSDDFEAAVEEGATVVRIGSAVFAGLLGERLLDGGVLDAPAESGAGGAGGAP